MHALQFHEQSKFLAAMIFPKFPGKAYCSDNISQKYPLMVFLCTDHTIVSVNEACLLPYSSVFIVLLF